MQRAIRYICPIVLTIASPISTAATVSPPPGEIAFSQDWQLGQAYDSRFQAIVEGNCFGSYTKTSIGQHTASVFSESNQSTSDLETMLKASLAGKADLGWGLLSGSVSGSYLSESSASAFTLTTHYLAKLRSKSELVADFQLNKEASDLLLEDRIDEFFDLCGTEYVAQRDLGSQLMINAAIDFDTEASREQFDVRVKVSALFGAIKKTWTWDRLQRSFGENSMFRLSAFQMGGDNDRLEDLLEGHPRSCPGNDVQACFAALVPLLEYAVSPDGFPAGAAERSVPTALVTRPYSGSMLRLHDGQFIHLNPISSGIEAMPFQLRAGILRLAERLNKIRSDISHLRNRLQISDDEGSTLHPELAQKEAEAIRHEDILFGPCSTSQLKLEGILGCLEHLQ